MSPMNRDLDVGSDEVLVYDEDDSEVGRVASPAVTRGPMQRSKRIRAGRRRNDHNGMQRRRNKRVNW